MSFFLENYNNPKITKTQKPSTKFNFESIEEGCLKFSEAITYGEIAWQNLTIKAMNEEYHIFREEAEENTNGAKKTINDKINNVKEWFKSVIEWIKKQFANVKNFVSNVFENLNSGYALIQTFAQTHEKEIKSAKKLIESKNIKLTLTKWANGKTIEPPATIISSFTTVVQKSKSAFDKGNYDAIQNSFKDVQDTIDGLIDKNQPTQEVTINGNIVEYAINICKDAVKYVAVVKNTMKQVSKTAEECNKNANAGANNNDPSKAEVLKTKVSNLKNKFILENKCASAILRMINKAVKDAHKVNKASYSAIKSNKSSNTNKSNNTNTKQLPAKV